MATGDPKCPDCKAYLAHSWDFFSNCCSCKSPKVQYYCPQDSKHKVHTCKCVNKSPVIPVVYPPEQMYCHNWEGKLVKCETTIGAGAPGSRSGIPKIKD